MLAVESVVEMKWTVVVRGPIFVPQLEPELKFAVLASGQVVGMVGSAEPAESAHLPVPDSHSLIVHGRASKSMDIVQTSAMQHEESVPLRLFAASPHDANAQNRAPSQAQGR